MNAYVNGFDCAINAEKSEVILSLKQNYPNFPINGVAPSTPTETEEICGIVMSRKVAENLASLLLEMLNANKTEE